VLFSKGKFIKGVETFPDFTGGPGYGPLFGNPIRLAFYGFGDDTVNRRFSAVTAGWRGKSFALLPYRGGVLFGDITRSFIKPAAYFVIIFQPGHALIHDKKNILGTILGKGPVPIIDGIKLMGNDEYRRPFPVDMAEKFHNFHQVSLSRSLVGSSAMSSRGSLISEWAIAARRISPPGSSLG
jgi:hypothetical protein